MLSPTKGRFIPGRMQEQRVCQIRAVPVITYRSRIISTPAAIAHRSHDSYIGYTLERGVQVESLAASTAWVAHRVTGATDRFAYRFKSWQIGGAGGAAYPGPRGLAPPAIHPRPSGAESNG